MPERDQSLQFMGCAGPWREVQLVRDRILGWMADDPTLQPRDVLVMTPDVERYAPLLASVFSDRDATGVDLPWRLTDRSQQSCPGLQQAFMTPLRLGADRLARWTRNPAGQRRCRPCRASAPTMRWPSPQRCSSGFRWGLDASDAGDDSHSLRWCLDRWLLGLSPSRATGTGQVTVHRH